MMKPVSPGGCTVNLISKEELKTKIERGDDFKLVFVLGEWHYRAKHIPGSLHIDTPEKGIDKLRKDDEIVVYCSNPTCIASQYAYNLLESNGYKNIKRYAGGIEDWERAGYPLEGEMVSRIEFGSS
jgi:rhodanese-related sulfurtransferase